MQICQYIPNLFNFLLKILKISSEQDIVPNIFFSILDLFKNCNLYFYYSERKILNETFLFMKRESRLKIEQWVQHLCQKFRMFII